MKVNSLSTCYNNTTPIIIRWWWWTQCKYFQNTEMCTKKKHLMWLQNTRMQLSAYWAMECSSHHIPVAFTANNLAQIYTDSGEHTTTSSNKCSSNHQVVFWWYFAYELSTLIHQLFQQHPTPRGKDCPWFTHPFCGAQAFPFWRRRRTCRRRRPRAVGSGDRRSRTRRSRTGSWRLTRQARTGQDKSTCSTDHNQQSLDEDGCHDNIQ